MQSGTLQVANPTREQRLRTAVLMWGLDEPTVDSEAVSLDADEWTRLFQWARTGKILGLLDAAAPALLALDGEQQESLRSAAVESVVTSMMIESSVAPVADALDEAGIDWRVLKGAVTSHLLYPRPGWRTIGDVDLLVRPTDLARALKSLGSLAATGPNVAHGPATATVLNEYLIVDAHRVEIDVHQAVQGSLLTSRLPIDAMFADSQSVGVADRSVTAPSTPALFVHAVLHLTGAGPTTSTVADIARLARICEPSDPRFDALLERRGASDLFAWGLDRARLSVPLPEAWNDHLDRIRPSPAVMRRLDWIHASQLRMHGVNHLTGGRRVRRLVEMVWPSEEYLAYHELTRGDHARYLGGKLVTLRRPRAPV